MQTGLGARRSTGTTTDQPHIYGQVFKIFCARNVSGWGVGSSGLNMPPGFVAIVEPPDDRWLGDKQFSKNFASDIAEIAAKASAHTPGLLIIALPADLKIDLAGCQLSRNDDRPPQQFAFPVLLMARHFTNQAAKVILQSHKVEAFTRRPTETRTYVNGARTPQVQHRRPAQQPQGRLQPQPQGNVLGRMSKMATTFTSSVTSFFTAPKLLSAELDKLLAGLPLDVLKTVEAIRMIGGAEQAGTLKFDTEKVCGMLVEKATADDIGLYLLLAWFFRRSSARKPTSSGDEEDAFLNSCFEGLLSKHVFDGSWRNMVCINVLQEQHVTFEGKPMMNHFCAVLSWLFENALDLGAPSIKGLVELQQLHATCLQRTGSKSPDFRDSWMLLFRALPEVHMQQGLQPLLTALSKVLQVRTSYGSEYDHEFGPEDHKNLVKILSPWVQTVTEFAMLVTICNTSSPEARVFNSIEAEQAFERAVAHDFNAAGEEAWVLIANEICEILSMLPHRSPVFSKIAGLAVRGACPAAGFRFRRDGFAPLDTLYASAAALESMSRLLLLESLSKHAELHFSKLSLPRMSDWLKGGTWDALSRPGWNAICELLTREQFRLHSRTDGDFSQVLALFSVLLKHLEGNLTAENHVRRMFCKSVELFLAVDVSASASKRQNAVMSLVRSLGDAGIEFSSCVDAFAHSFQKGLQQAFHTSSSHRRLGENEKAMYQFCAELCKVLNGLNIETLPSLLDQAIESSVAATITGSWGPEHDAQLLRSRFSQLIDSAESMAARRFVLALVLCCLQSCPSDLSSCTILLTHCKPIEDAYTDRSLNDPARAFLCVTYELANRVSKRFATASHDEAAWAEICTRMATVSRSFEELCTKTRNDTITGTELVSMHTQWVVLNALEDAIVFFPDDDGKSLPSASQLEEKHARFVEAAQFLQQQSQLAAAMTRVGVDRSALVDHDDAICSPERCAVAAVLRARAATEEWIAPMQPHAGFFEYFYMATQRTKSILFAHMLEQQLTEALSPNAFADVLLSVKEKLEKLLQAEEVDLVEMQEAGAQRALIRSSCCPCRHAADTPRPGFSQVRS